MSECANCKAVMQDEQDWCVQCGAARAQRLAGTPGWLTGAGVLAATALLVAGASVAAYAALSRHAGGTHRALALRTPTIAQATAPSVPGGSATTTPVGPGATRTPALPTGAAPPKIPTQTPTPEGSKEGEKEGNPFFPPESGKGSKAAQNAKTGSGAKGKSGKSSGKGTTEGVSEGGGGEGSGSEGGSSNGSKGGSSGEAQASAPILLDTNAASTYDPNGYASSLFGDPSLAIDGEASTDWTAGVQAAVAPRVLAGLVLDLRTAQKLGRIKVRTPTTGIAVEVYGANGHDLPASIGDPAWKKLHGPRLLRKRSVTFKLKTKGAAYRFVLLWIVRAPSSSTPAAPGHVAISELELFAPS